MPSAGDEAGALARYFQASTGMPQRWDIFCRVIDNFGDAGVCWRLARQLRDIYGLCVRLWVDDLNSLRALCPALDPAQARQHLQGVEICHWPEQFPATAPAEVVIEAFACELPPAYLAAMVPQAPIWINLEYLTAEPWVVDYHAQPSPHPNLPLTKTFFFPGFFPSTGGLLRAQRSAPGLASPGLCAQLGLPEPPAEALKVSLFGYENSAVNGLLHAWQQALQPVVCLLPVGRLLPQVAAWVGQPLRAGLTIQRGSLTLHVLPFLAQEDYDRLLWTCDCNFVRGEDSFVQAQWAGKPLVWQIYPQQDAAHWKKLAAFLDLYCDGLPDQTAHELREFWRLWNAQESLDWPRLRSHLEVLNAHAQRWKSCLGSQPSLVENLVFFCKNKV